MGLGPAETGKRPPATQAAATVHVDEFTHMMLVFVIFLII
jgi:hypothetical protein